MQEREEARVPELLPEPPRVEVREGDEKLGHGSVLAVKELGEVPGQIACVHAGIVARDFSRS